MLLTRKASSIRGKQKNDLHITSRFMELMTGFEPVTSALVVERPSRKNSFFAFAEELLILAMVDLSVEQQFRKIGRIAHPFFAQKHLDDVFDTETKANDEADGSQKDEVGIVCDESAEHKGAAENERPEQSQHLMFEGIIFPSQICMIDLTAASAGDQWRADAYGAANLYQHLSFACRTGLNREKHHDEGWHSQHFLS